MQRFQLKVTVESGVSAPAAAGRSGVLQGPRRNAKRKPAGSSFIELAAGLIVVIPIVLYGIDAAVLYMGQSINADCCREACRAAANGPPNYFSAGTAYTPRARADQVLLHKYNAKAIIRVDPNCVINEQVFSPIPQAPFGGPVNGVVTVKTTVKILPPILIPLIPPQIVFAAQQTYPYTWTMPSTVSSTGGGSGGTNGQLGGTSSGSNSGTGNGSQNWGGGSTIGGGQIGGNTAGLPNGVGGGSIDGTVDQSSQSF